MEVGQNRVQWQALVLLVWPSVRANIISLEAQIR